MPIHRILTAVVLAGTAFFVGCQEENEYQPPPPPPVIVARPISLPVSDYLETTGTTEAVETVDIRARVQGYLQEIKFESGQQVSEGQVLFVIEKAPFEATVAEAEAALVVAQAEAADAKAKYERALPLLATRSVTEEEVQEKKALYAVGMAKIEAARASLSAAKLELSYTDVKSPIAGRAGKHLVDVGNLVGGLNATQLTTVIKYDPIYANFSISEAELLAVQRAAPRDEQGRVVKPEDMTILMALADEDGFPHRGTFDYADLGVESSTGTYSLRASFPNPQRMIAPGMFVRIRIPMGEPREAMLVPEKAVGADQRGRYVKTVTSDNKVELHYVEVGARKEQWRVIGSGLDTNAEVIVEGLQRARVEGDVTVVRDEKAVQDALPPEPKAE